MPTRPCVSTSETSSGADVYTDESRIYSPVSTRTSVNHDKRQYVTGFVTL